MPSRAGLGISASERCAASEVCASHARGNSCLMLSIGEIKMKISKSVLAGMAVAAACVGSAVDMPIAIAAGNSRPLAAGRRKKEGHFRPSCSMPLRRAMAPSQETLFIRYAALRLRS